MEENNRRDEQTVDVNAVIEENNKIREAYGNLVNRYNDLNNTWMLTRANFLIEVVKNKEFPKDLKDKAIAELTEFLYPTRKEEVVKEKKEEKE